MILNEFSELLNKAFQKLPNPISHPNNKYISIWAMHNIDVKVNGYDIPKGPNPHRQAEFCFEKHIDPELGERAVPYWKFTGVSIDGKFYPENNK